MDIKESNMLKHYKQLIENREFDEYDIYAFLILIRDHIPKGKLKIFRDFADAVAHREKKKGISKDEIMNLVYYIRSIPRHKFEAADVADMIIRRYFKELNGDYE